MNARQRRKALRKMLRNGAVIALICHECYKCVEQQEKCPYCAALFGPVSTAEKLKGVF